MSALADVPALCLNGSTRNFLAARLDPETPMTTDDCLSRDWRGVAEVSRTRTLRGSSVFDNIKQKKKKKKKIIITHSPIMSGE